MDINKTLEELYRDASVPKIFSMEELLIYTNSTNNLELLKTAIINKSRFVSLRLNQSDRNCFILDSMLFKWFVRLNIRLAQKRIFRLDDHQIASLLSQLWDGSKWESTPNGALRWGQSLGLICHSLTRGQYVFPLAKILSFVKKSKLNTFSDILLEFGENQIWNKSLRKHLKPTFRT